MPTSILWALANQQLPVVVKGCDDVDAIQILVMAGHVEAEIAAAVPSLGGWVHPVAEVKRITRLGRHMLRHFPPEPHDRQHVTLATTQ